jgi:hypothetical protein
MSAAIAAAGIGAAAGIAGGMMAANAAGDAADSAANAQAKSDRANLAMYVMSRGGALDEATVKKLGLPMDLVGKQSSILPLYLSKYESDLGKNAAEMALKLQKGQFESPEEEMAFYRAIQARYGAANDAARATGISAVDGTMSAEMLADAEPVFAARTGVAESRKNAGLEALAETLNEIDAVQARRGFAGDSMGSRMLKFNARRGIATQGATDLGEARLQNEADRAGLKEAGRQLRLGAINLPDQLASADMSRSSMGERALGSRFNSAMEPLRAFRVEVGNPPNAQTPTYQTVPSTGEIIANSVSGLGNTAMNYFMSQSLMKQLGSSGNNSNAALQKSLMGGGY